MQLNDAKRKISEDFIVNHDKVSPRSSIMTSGFKQEYLNVKVESLLPFRNQARRKFDEESLQKLAKTIKEHGIRQPLSVIISNTNPGFYEVVSGERRLRAAKIAGLEKVPCILIKDETKAEEIAIIENIQRQDLHPFELLSAYKNLLDKKICTSMQEVADKVGSPKSSVVEVMNLQNLPDMTRSMIITNNLKSRRLFRTLLNAEPHKHVDIINAYMAPERNDESDKQKKRDLSRRANVLSIVLEGDDISVTHNKISRLSIESKEELKAILMDVLTELN
jgi:ParB family chromosome partitioning protein